jgi:2-amino-4-hydroxy-6-hydroxymethyldihydropteridine diphosphokinase
MKVFVGVGSNLGDREFLIRKAVESMRDLPRTLVVRVSSLYDTDPVGEVEQPVFLNAVVLIEKRMGRVRSQRWGPRPIDLDLLFYGEETVDEPDLKIPHPEAHRRAFVLLPLLELDPEFVHPTTGELVKKTLKRLPPNPPVRKGGRFWY